MITLYPRITETLVLPLTPEEVLARIESILDKPFLSDGYYKVIEGALREDNFRLMIRTRRLQLFTPLISGTIEKTSKGSLVFLTYSFYPGTKVLLTFFSLILPLISIPLFYEFRNIAFAAGLWMFTLLMHIAARANFKLHVRLSQKLFHQLLA